MNTVNSKTLPQKCHGSVIYCYLSSYIYQFQLAAVTYHILSTQQLTYLVNLLHFSDISRTLRSSVSKQLFVPKLNIGKHAFSVAAPTIWNQLPITIKSSETIDTIRKKNEVKTYLFEIFFLHKCSVVPCSNDNFCLSLFMYVPLSLNFLRIEVF